MAKKADSAQVFNWRPKGILTGATLKKSMKPLSGAAVYFVGQGSKTDFICQRLRDVVPDWQLEKLRQSDKDLNSLTGTTGPIWVVQLNKSKKLSGFDLYPLSPYALARNAIGGLWGQVEASGLKELTVFADDLSPDEKLGMLVGIEVAAYKYLKVRQPSKNDSGLSGITLVDISEKLLHEGGALASGVNLARHLVNLPACDLNPKTYSEAMSGLFKNFSHTKVDVWNRARLEKEKMGLLLAVGQGAVEEPRLLHIRYRPPGAKRKPIAFVGKGITFDSGGLDIKPSNAMRLMKKDMGGSATVMGLAYYVISSGLKVACDFYAPMAENAVDGKSFRPGDVLHSRQGMTVEIDNTDAEGRLVLADALDVAATQTGAHEPELVINVATLTGAARVALGLEVGALFATQDKVGDKIFSAGKEMGDFVWRMPLVQSYDSQLCSQFADTNHASASGMGGAITAALFLKKFVKDKPWAHLDVMAWTDSRGPYRETGGNGQAVQCLARFVKQL